MKAALTSSDVERIDAIAGELTKLGANRAATRLRLAANSPTSYWSINNAVWYLMGYEQALEDRSNAPERILRLVRKASDVFYEEVPNVDISQSVP